MTTIHAYTNDQVILDFPHEDLRRARAAAQNIIPTTTGAAKAVSLVIPELKGKLDGIAMRVPVPDGSVTDLVVDGRARDDRRRGQGRVPEGRDSGSAAGLPRATPRTRSSRSDIVGDPHSCIFDALLTMANGRLVKVVGWYDNEWGYSNRLASLAALVGSRALGRMRSVDDLDGRRPARPRPLRPERPHGRTAEITDDGRIGPASLRSRPSWSGWSRRGLRHLGRPKGRPNPKYSLAPVARRLGELLGTPIASRRRRGRSAQQVEGCDGGASSRTSASTRGERSRRPGARGRAGRARPTATSPTASAPCTARMPASSAYPRCSSPRPAISSAKELEVLAAAHRWTRTGRTPSSSAARRSRDKLGVITSLLGKVDRLLIGGGMCFTFLAAAGHDVGDSLLEADQLDAVRGMLATARERGVALLLPTDVVIAQRGECGHGDAGGGRRRDPRRAGRAWTSGPTRSRRSPARWPTPRRCSGTGRWACSSWRRSPPGPSGWPRRWRRRSASRWSAAETRRRRCASSAWPSGSGHISTGGGASPGVPRGQDAPRRRRSSVTELSRSRGEIMAARCR